MARTRAQAIFGKDFMRGLWRLARAYWTSGAAGGSRVLLALAVTLELATVYGAFVLAEAQRRIFDALQQHAAAAFLQGIGLFLAVVLGFVLVSTYRIYLRQIVEIRWRTWLTGHLLEKWIHPLASCQMELLTAATDNPDQRIAEDVRNFVSSALGLSLSLLGSVATLVSFAGLLYTLSGDWPLRAGGVELHVPGFMMWVAILYGVLATWIAHRVGRPLVAISFDRLRLEADFRFGLVRFRENAEAIGLANGEVREREAAQGRFRRVASNWWQLIRTQRNLTLFATGLGQANQVVPLLIAAPGYFLGRLTLGSVAQVNIAYAQVSGALAWFVNAYQEIATWRASIERLLAFERELDASAQRIARPDRVHLETGAEGALRVRDLRLELPNGRVLVDAANGAVAPGESVLLVGPSGAGQTTLLRAIAGDWPFGSGRVELPPGARTMFLSQRPYLPIASLRAAVCYPEPEGAFADDAIREALRRVGLADLAERLDETDHWEKRLSGGEQERLAFARALLHRPDWIFLDDATAELDDEGGARAYDLLSERLPKAALVSIAHRPAALAAHHARSWTLRPGQDGRATLEAA